MTYIVAGKTKNSTFLMADCISTNEDNNYTLTDKLVKLDSSCEETYFSMCGNPFILNCILTINLWFKVSNRTNDFIYGEESIKIFVEVIKKMLESYHGNPFQLGKNRLFFIDKNNIAYYDFIFNQQNQLDLSPQKIIIPENNDIDADVLTPSKPAPIELKKDETIESYCIKCLDFALKRSKKEYSFKDRYSFVHFHKGEIEIKYPYKRISDIIAYYNEVNYSEIDDTEFVLNL